MSEKVKNVLYLLAAALIFAVAIAIISRAGGLLQAILVVLVLAGSSLAITFGALLLSRRSASRGLVEIVDRYYESGRSERVLYSRYPESLLGLPVADQSRIFRRLASSRAIPDQNVTRAVDVLESGEFPNPLDRIRIALTRLLDVEDLGPPTP